MWSSITFERADTVDYLKACLELGKGGPIDLSLVLATSSRLSSDLVCGVLQASLHRSRALNVSLLDSQSARHFIAVFQDVELDSLLQLTVTAVVVFPVPQRRSPRHRVQLSIDRPLPRLTRLRLRGLTIEWPSTLSFHLLTCLVLMDLLTFPSWDDYCLLASSAPLLSKLCLRNVGCTTFPRQPHSLLTFPSLTDIDLAFGTAPSSLRLVRSFVAPELKRMRFHGRSSIHFVSLALCTSLLHATHFLTLSGRCDDSFIMHFAFLNLPLLRSLDILSSDEALLVAIATADSVLGIRGMNGPGACPHLSALTVTQATPTQVREFMERRGDSGAAISTIGFRGGASQWAASPAEDLAWIRTRAMFRLLTPYQEEAWVRMDLDESVVS